MSRPSERTPLRERFYRLFGIHAQGAPLSARQRRHLAVCLACVLVLALGAGYVVCWLANQARVERESDLYSSLYQRQETPEPAATAAPPPTPTPTAQNAPSPSERATPTPTARPAATPTAQPTTIIQPTPMPTARPTPSPTPWQTPVPMATAPDEPIPTPDADTIVISAPTPPPVQASFDELRSLNPDTVGFLAAGELVSLPVAQRLNDNEYYLTHNFSGAEAQEGALFLDGMNRLEMQDQNLIVYGHNMRNNTMFGRLDRYRSLAYVRKSGPVQFDTVYENGLYIPFAAFVISTDERSAAYMELRRFTFTEAEFDEYLAELRRRSEVRVPVDVAYGDQLLTLVTCNYTRNDGRFVLTLRRLRPGETEAEARELLAGATKK